MHIVSLNAIINRKNFLHSQPYTFTDLKALGTLYILIVILKSSASSEDRRVVFAVS